MITDMKFSLDVLPPGCLIETEWDATLLGARVRFVATKPRWKLFGWWIGEVRSLPSGWFDVETDVISLTWSAFWDEGAA